MPIDAAGRWSPGLFPRQKEALDACAPGQSQNLVLLSGPRWASKCVSPDTLIALADGVCPIGQMGQAPEDLFSPINKDVASFNGQGFVSAKATQFYNSGCRDGVRLKTEHGYEITCSKPHPVWSEHDGHIGYRTSEEIAALVLAGKSVWLPLIRQHPLGWASRNVSVEFAWFSNQERRSFEASERIKAAVADGHSGFYNIMRKARAGNVTVHKWIDNPMEPRMLAVTIDEDMAYAMGLLVGDGNYTPPVLRSHSMHYSGVDYEINSSLNQILSQRFPDFKMKHASRCDYNIQSSSLRAFIKEVGMAGKYAHEKDIPSVIFRSPKSVIVGFLQGLFDTDGTVEPNGQVSFSTSSEILSRQVQTLLLMLGVRSSRIFRSNDYKGSWRVSAQTEDGFEHKIGFRLLRKQARIVRKRKFKRARGAYPESFKSVLKALHTTRKERGVGTLKRMVHKHTIDAVFRGNVSLSRKRIKPLLEVLQCENVPRVQDYIAGWSIWWDKVAQCEGKACHFVDIAVPETHNFVGNGFINHNTFACHHILCQHAWNTDRANICILTITQSAGVDSGPWQHLTEVFIPDWISGEFGFEWVRKPYVQSVTKKPTCLVSNKFGTYSRISLESLKDEREVEERFKGKEFSMIWVNELSKFRQRKTFDTLKQQLRAPHLKAEQMLFLADTNPCLDTGKGCEWYKLWYDFRTASPDELRHIFPELDPTTLLPLQQRLKLIEFSVDDNLALSPEKKAELMADFAHDPDLVAAYYWGQWVTASVDALFFKVFRPLVQVIGEPETPANDDPEIMVPEEGCMELITGMDPGDSVNSAAVIAEKTHRIEIIQTKTGLVERKLPVLKYLDEVVWTGEAHSLEDFTVELMLKMMFWEKELGRSGNVMWRHWSDRSVFDRLSPESQRYLHQIVFDASVIFIKQAQARGETPPRDPILLQGADRGPGSVGQRIDLTRRLLFDERMYFSKSRTPRLIESVKGLKKGTGTVNVSVQRGSPLKHAWDAATYLAMSECSDELNRAVVGHMLASRRKSEGTLVTLAL